MNKMLPYLLSGVLVVSPGVVTAQTRSDDKKHQGLLIPHAPVVREERSADTPDLKPVKWVASVIKERQQQVIAGMPAVDVPRKITQEDLVSAIDSKTVEKAVNNGWLVEIRDDTGNMLARAKERFPDIAKEIETRKPQHSIQIVFDPTDDGVNANLVVTPKGKGRNFLILSNGFFQEQQKQNYQELPVAWVAETVQHRTGTQVLGKIDQPTLNKEVTPEAVQAAIKSGRLVEIPPEELKAVPKNQYENIIDRKIKKWPHKSKFVVLVDTWDNDGGSKVNLIITPRKKGVNVPEGEGTQVNYLIVSEGAHRWTRKYVEDHRTFHEDEINQKIRAGELSSLLKLDASSPQMLSRLDTQDTQLLQEARKIARLEKLPSTPLILIDMTSPESAPPMAALGSMTKKDGTKELFLAINRSARKLYADTVELDAVLGHEFEHGQKSKPGQGGDLDPVTIAWRHNLSPEAQSRVGIASEDRADRASEKLGFGQGLEQVIEKGDAAVLAATGMTQQQYDELGVTNPGAHRALQDRIDTIRRERESLGNQGAWTDREDNKDSKRGTGGGTPGGNL
jgi:hypothetical protein